MVQATRRKIHYIYKITRLDDSGKYYFGMHSTDNINDGYFGSGQLLWKSIKKHGKEKHSKEILEFLDSREALRKREAEIVNEELLKDPKCLNLQLGGYGGDFKKGRVVSQSEKGNMSKRRKGVATVIKHTEKTKAIMREKTKVMRDTGIIKTWAKTITPERRKEMVTKANKSRAYPLFAYSPLDSTFIKEFPAHDETAKLLGVTPVVLCKAVKDQRVVIGGYLWSRVKTDNLGITQNDITQRSKWAARPKSAKSINQFTLDNKFIRSWESVSAATREFGCRFLIDRSIATGREAHGYIFKR